MFCPNCGKQNEDASKFCEACGTALEKVQAEVVAEEVNEAAGETVEQVAVAVETEAPEAVEAQEEVSEEKAEETAAEEPLLSEEYIPEKRGGALKKIIIAVVALAVLAVVAFTAIKFFGIFESDEVDYGKYPVIYEKDGEIMVLAHGKKESYELTDADGDDEYDYYYDRVQLTKDGKGIFFTDSYSEDATLYFRKTSDMNPKDGDGTEIAEDVTNFQAFANKKAVVYIRDGGKLCYSDTKNEKVIDKHVIHFAISNDEKKVMYEDEDSDLYVCGFGKNDKPKKIDSDVTDIVSKLGEYEDIYYTRDDKLYYKANENKDKQKIASDVSSAFFVGDNLYVMKEDKVELDFDDLFENDLPDKSELVDPDDLEAPRWSDYYYAYDNYEDANDAYDDAYDEYWDEWEEAYDRWNAYEEMEEIEEYYDNYPVEMSTYTLYLAKGSKLTKLDEDISSSYVDVSNDYGFYSKQEAAKIKKIKLSEVDYYSAQTEVNNMLYDDDLSGTFCVITPKGKVFEGFEIDEYIGSCEVSENGKYLYLEETDKSDETNLVRYEIKGSSLANKKTLLEDINYFMYYDDDCIVARVEDNDEFGYVGYINNKEVEISDEAGYITYLDGTLYFLDDYSDYSGELVSWKNGKKKTIADDVYDFEIYSESKIAFIQDYDEDDGYGDLYIGNKNGKCKQIDDEVSRIIWINNDIY